MAGQQRRFTPREKSYLSEYSLKLSGPVVNGARFPSEFRMAFAGNKVAIQVETKLQDAKNYGRHEIVVPYMTAIGILEIIRELLNKKLTKISYRVKDFVFFGRDKKSDQPMVKATMTVGRDADGTVYIGMSGKDITPVKFPFALAGHDELVDDQGNQLNPAETSEFAAHVFVGTYYHLLPAVMALHYKEPEKKGGNGGGNSGGNGGYSNNNQGGGYSNGGGNGGGSQRDHAAANASFDNDLPF